MPNYQVEICRVAFAVREIDLVADNAQDAAGKASDEAGDLLFSEHGADYKVNHVINRDTGEHETFSGDQGAGDNGTDKFALPPKFCPRCGGQNIYQDVSEAVPESLRAIERQSGLLLAEHQCGDCEGASFWM